MAKPFSIQSPEDIAKEYAGNKQKIAQAMQMGIVDPTAGVLAGMFIDRMRSAQMQEGMPQATVAQQVMGGAPPVPVNPLPAGGLGSLPQGAPPMAPPMDMAPPAPQMPAPQQLPMGMADGGLASLPVPDAMFDEPTNGGFDDGYAGGGIVAFADGGTTLKRPEDWGAYIEQMARKVAPDLRVTSRGRSAQGNAQVGGVTGSYHLIGAARDFVPPKGVSMEALHAQLKRQFGSGYDVINEGDHIHVEPGPTLGRAVRAGTPFNPADVGRLRPAEEAPRTSAATPSVESLQAAFPGALKAAEEYYAANMPQRKNEGLDLLTAQAREVLDPENQKRQRDQDKWMALAEIGFNMAASNSPFLLQAAGAAAAAALPGARAAKKEREAAKREAIRDLAAAEDITYKQAAEKTKFVLDFAGTELGLKKEDLARDTQVQLEEMQQKGATERTRMEIQGDLDVARAQAAAEAADNKPMSNAQLVDVLQSQKTAMNEAIEEMKAAEAAGEAGNYALFRDAAIRYGVSLQNYNSAAQKLGLAQMNSITFAGFPKMSAARKARLAREGQSGGAGAPAAGKPPAGVTQAEWNAMTPQERALFK